MAKLIKEYLLKTEKVAITVSSLGRIKIQISKKIKVRVLRIAIS